MTHERDNLRSRLNAARGRIDALLERLPHESEPGDAAPATGNASMKQIEVTILGQSYLLGCPEGGEASLLDAVAQVDREMSAIRDAGKVKARERIAVLAALNLAYALAERPRGRSRPTAARGSAVDVDGADPPRRCRRCAPTANCSDRRGIVACRRRRAGTRRRMNLVRRVRVSFIFP